MNPIITTQEIHRIYKNGALEYRVLNGVSLTVEHGEFVAIMGKSGAGKSTLLYQLSGLDSPTSGTVTVKGTIITTLNEEELVTFRRNTLGYIFQDYALVPELDAVENVMLPLLMRGVSWREAKHIAKATLISVGLADKFEHLPSQLSGGEQQRVSIARAVAGKPSILFADEPTANLDSVSGRSIIALLKTFHEQGQTIVMVTHEDEYAHQSERIVYLEDGKVIDEKSLKKISDTFSKLHTQIM